MSSLLGHIGVYYQAIQYTEDLLKINESMKDTFNLAHNHKMMGVYHLHKGNYVHALENFDIAEKWAKYLGSVDLAEMRMYKAALYYRMDSVMKALNIIRPVISRIDSLSKDVALAYASKIYLDANILDTAYMYARFLTSQSDFRNKKTGYSVILSNKLREFISQDSLEYFQNNYKDVLENHFKYKEANAAIIQNSMYNYALHDRLRYKAEKSKTVISQVALILVTLTVILIIILLFIGYKHKSRLVELHKSLTKITMLENSIKNASQEYISGENEESNQFCENMKIDSLKDEDALKIKIRNTFMSIKTFSIPFDISVKILESKVYYELQRLVKNSKPVSTPKIWNELETIITTSYPKFKYRLQVLADGSLPENDFQLCMLIRCGFSPKEIAILLGRTNGAITYRRKKLSKKLFGEELKLDLFDDIILRL